jgi:hypothetical protein
MSVRSFEQNEASSEDRSFQADGTEAPKGYKVWRVDLPWSGDIDGRLGQGAEATAGEPKQASPKAAQPRR